MALGGFILILINALGYILNWESNFTPLGIIGIVFVVIGMNMVRKK